MSLTTCRPIEITLHTTNLWLEDLMKELGWKDRDQAYQALRVVLHALRDRLPEEAMAALAAQLPLLIRGIYYEGWDPSGKPLNEPQKEDFLCTDRGGLPEQPGGRSGEGRLGRLQGPEEVCDVRRHPGHGTNPPSGDPSISGLTAKKLMHISM